MNKNNKAFTIIELIVIVVIFGFISMIFLPKHNYKEIDIEVKSILEELNEFKDEIIKDKNKCYNEDYIKCIDNHSFVFEDNKYKIEFILKKQPNSYYPAYKCNVFKKTRNKSIRIHYKHQCSRVNGERKI